MKEKWGTRWGLIEYLESMWLKEFKEALVRAWVDCYPHFRTRTTINYESAHWKLKSMLNTSISGFYDVTNYIDNTLRKQIDQIKGSLESSRLNVNRSVSSLPVFAPLLQKVIDECFNLLLANYNKAKALCNDDRVCWDRYCGTPTMCHVCMNV